MYQYTEFDKAFVPAGGDLVDARRQLDRFPTFYQADVVTDAPFRRPTAGNA
jgi:hypothetical protein